MNRILFSASALALMAGSAFAQNQAPTAAESGNYLMVKADGNQLPASLCWYNGDLDFRNGFASERNTIVSDAWTFDNVNWAGGNVTGFRGNFLSIGTPVGADVIVYSGLGEGTFGTLMGGVSDVTNFTFTPTGNSAFGYTEMALVADLGGSAFSLAPGNYHVGVRPVGPSSGRHFVSVTSGANAIGTPPGNDGNTFLQSNFFGYPLPTNWQNLVGAGTWDVSYGLECGSAGIVLSNNATCPGGGAISVSWTGATNGGQVALIYANNTGSVQVPPGPCFGTTLGLGASGIQKVFSGGSGAGGSRTVNGNAPGAACGKFLQLLDVTTCGTSNVSTIN